MTATLGALTAILQVNPVPWAGLPHHLGAALYTRRAKPSNYMKVEDAATANTGVWITFFAVVILYALVGTTTILVLRGMIRRFRMAEGFTDHDTRYGPSELTEASVKSEETVG
jgi:hypothetical protein